MDRLLLNGFCQPNISLFVVPVLDLRHSNVSVHLFRAKNIHRGKTCVCTPSPGGHDATKHVNAESVRREVQRSPRCAEVVSLLGLDKINATILASHEYRCLPFVEYNLVSCVAGFWFEACRYVGELGLAVFNSVVSASVSDNLVKNNCRGNLFRVKALGPVGYSTSAERFKFPINLTNSYVMQPSPPSYSVSVRIGYS